MTMRLEFDAGLAAAVFFTAATAFAQAQPVPAAPAQGPAGTSSPPGGIPVGPLTVYPGVDLAHGYDDNLFLRPSSRSSSSYTTVSPYVRAEGRTGPHKFDFGLRIDDGRYHSSGADNYTNYALTGNADLVYSGRAGLRLTALHRHAVEPRGSTDRTFSAVPDEYDNTGIEGTFRYGAPGARGRIEVDGAAYALRYTNNRAFTEIADRDSLRLGGRFFWRVGPRTELLLEAQRGDVDYRHPGSTQDSLERRLLVGVKWEATAATTGTAKFGRMKKEFNSAGRQGVSDSSWDVGVRWSPLTYSVFDFVSSKQTNESTGVGDAVVSKNYGANWSHAWSSRLRTLASAGWRNDTFPGGSTREDDTASFGLRVDYDFRRWLRLGAGLTHTERDSNDSNFNYKRNLLLFTVGATL
jgi:hypothetical protein